MQMIGPDLLIAAIDVCVAWAVLAVYMRRDRGIVPEDNLPDALRESTRSFAKAAKADRKIRLLNRPSYPSRGPLLRND
jgi:hypothetical protein